MSSSDSPASHAPYRPHREAPAVPPPRRTVPNTIFRAHSGAVLVWIGLLAASPLLAQPATEPMVDRILMKNGDEFSGQVAIEGLSVNTTYGLVTLPRPLLAEVSMTGEGKNVETLISVDGDRFSGFLLEQSLPVDVAAGNRLAVRKETVSAVRFQPPETRETTPTPDVILMRNTDAFRARVTTPSFSVQTSYGELSFNAAEIASIDFEGDTRIVAKVTLREDKGTFQGTLGTEEIQLATLAGQELTVYRDKIKRLELGTPAPAETAGIVPRVDFRGDPAGPAEPGAVFDDNAPTMVRISGGCFEMGSPAGEVGRSDVERLHRVCVDAFSIGQYEVTQSQWKAVMGNKPARFAGCDLCPVNNVSWNDVDAYIDELNLRTGGGYRLPTEAEWEYAARAGNSTVYPWDDSVGRNRANCDGCGSEWDKKRTAPVGSFAPNSWGLYDTVGNVWEWTCSVFDAGYGGAEQRCAGENDAGSRALRGGSWLGKPRGVRSASRSWGTPDDRHAYLGFRLAQD